MSLVGMGLGGAAGFALGGPAGAVVGAGLGNYVEDNVLGGGAPKPGQAPRARATEYRGTSNKYDEQRGYADERKTPGMDWKNADAEQQNAQAARARQMALADRLQERVDGTLPSFAEMQLKRGQENNLRAQMNAAANTRGGGGAALAAQAEASRAGLMAGQSTNAEAAMLRFREQAEAEQQLAGLLGNVRGQDYSGVGLGQQRAGMGADMELRSRGLNDARSMGLLQADIEERKARAGIASQGAALDYQGEMAAWAAQNAAAQSKYNASQQMTGSLIGAGAGMYGAQAAAGAKGGGGGGGTGGGSPAPSAPTGGGGGYTYTDSYGEHYVPPGS